MTAFAVATAKTLHPLNTLDNNLHLWIIMTPNVNYFLNVKVTDQNVHQGDGSTTLDLLILCENSDVLSPFSFTFSIQSMALSLTKYSANTMLQMQGTFGRLKFNV